MAKASPYVFEAGNARWSPPQHQPTVGDTVAALPAPCEAAKRVIESVAERVMLNDRPHSELVANARRNIDMLDTGTGALEWVLLGCLLFAVLVLAWLAIVYWRRGTKIEKA